jgi:hypothetical protein
VTEQVHADAGLNLLRAVVSPTPALVVYDGKVPDGATAPYVVVYTHVEQPRDAEGNALDGTSKTVTARWICHCVGGDGIAARAVAQRVRGALLDVRPVIAGRECGLISEEQSLPPTRDETTGALVMDAVRIYRLRTEPA